MNLATAVEPVSNTAAQGWSALKRLAFRFCFVYFGLYCFVGMLPGLLPIPKVELPDPLTLWPFRPAIFWVAAHLFGARLPLVYTGSGSGDKTWDWTEIFCILIVALAATVTWSALDRNRRDYITLHKWFRLYIRFCLGATMLLYAFDKIVPLQMSYPFLTSQLQPFSAFSPAGILWNSIGASPAYEVFAGLAELLGAVLLMFPRTTTLGALVCLVDMTQVWMLNMTYDVPVKQFSFHLWLLSIFLLAPQVPRLVDFFVRGRAVAAQAVEPLFESLRANRIAAWVQAVLWIWILSVNTYQSASSWREYGGGRPKSALYGIWDVTEMTADGQVRPPLLNDNGRWRRMIFDFPEMMTAQHLDDAFERFQVSLDASKNALLLSKQDDKAWKASFSYQRPAPDELLLTGTMAGHNVQMQLKRVDEKKFLLASRGFHWVQEYPFIR